MKFAYADPPYIGQAKRHYSCEEVDHEALVNRLVQDYPDGWALSCTARFEDPRWLMGICPSDCRLMAWVKPFASFKPGVNPAYAWEPVIVRGGRKRGREKHTVRDWVSANITMRRGLAGAKPEDFCFWLFEVLGAEQGDELDDLFVGTGAVTRAWNNFLAQERFAI